MAEQLWRCPRCKGQLRRSSDRLTCTDCSASYGLVGEIPDFRISGRSRIDADRERSEARQLLAETAGLNYHEMVRWVFARRPGWDKWRIDLRTQQVMAAPERLRNELHGWLQPILKSEGTFLDVGCGNGTLLAAAASLGRQGIGVDVSMVWLQVAARMIEAHGGRPVLAGAMAEALPLADNAVECIASLDVIEHVSDVASYLTEIDRVTKPYGFLGLATPNQFSFAAEPHVFLWGLGFLPRRLQKHYVRWRRGESYEFTHLLSPAKAARLVRQLTEFHVIVVVPPVPEQEIVRFSKRRRVSLTYITAFWRWA